MGIPAQVDKHTGSTEPDDRALYARLLAGDPTAPSDFIVAYLEPLYAWLCATFRTHDRHLLETVAMDVLLGVAQAPGKYDPARGGLGAFLRMAARRDVQNALRTEWRRARRSVSLETALAHPSASDVEVGERLGNMLPDAAPDPAELVARVEPLDPELVALLRSSFSPPEWEVVRLMLEGERRTAIYAGVLHLDDRPEVEQAHEVKRVKDRLQKRLHRLAPRLAAYRKVEK